MPSEVRYEGSGRCTVPAKLVRQRADRMLRALEMPAAELSILLCDDRVIRRLNRRYRRIDRATDVLAFAMSEGAPVPGPERLLGDVVISLPTASRQARAGRKLVRDEVTILLAHGLLHLLGFDHATAAQDRRMRARVEILVSAAGGP